MHDDAHTFRDPARPRPQPAPAPGAPPLRLAGAEDDEDDTIVRGID
ncbi:hypothetical protein ACIRP3_00670 [Streptomyces sp. NPDC101209]